MKANLTVVLQFEGVLCSVKSTNKGNIVKLRPYAEDLIHNLKQMYEVVIFTCLMPEQFEEPCEILSEANAVLFKYHAVRYRGTLLKDLSRIGRKLEEMILIDDQPARNLMESNKHNTVLV